MREVGVELDLLEQIGIEVEIGVVVRVGSPVPHRYVIDKFINQQTIISILL